MKPPDSTSFNYFELTTLNTTSNSEKSHLISDESLSPNLAALFLLVIPTATIVGNLLVVVSVYREKTLRTATNYLIISMASADLLVAIFVMPFAVYVEVKNGFWKLPKSLCTVYTATDVCASTASILNLVAISWDRYLAVSKPIEYSRSHKKNRRVLIAIVVVWLCSIVIALPVLSGLNRLDDTPYCEFTNAFFIIGSSFASFFLPCFVMVGLYAVVLQKLRKRQLQIQASRRKNQYSRMSSTKRSKKSNQSSLRTTVDTNLSNATRDLSMTVEVSPPVDTIFQDYNCTVIGTQTQIEDSNTQNSNNVRGIYANPSLHSNATIDSPNVENTIATQKAPEPIDDDDEICSDFASSISANSLQIALSGSCTPSFDRRFSTTRDDTGDSDDESSLLMQNLLAPIDRNRNDDKSINRSTDQSIIDNCNGALKHLITNGSLSSHISTAIAPLVSTQDLQKIVLALPEIRIDAEEISEQDPPKDILFEEVLLQNLQTKGKADTNPQTNLVSLLNTPATPKDSRRQSAISIGVGAIASRFREMASSSKQPVMSSARRAAAARYSRQCRKERKATYMLGVVLVVFLACWLPFFTCHMTNSVCIVQSGETCINIVAFFLTSWLGYMNSFMNPLIYTIFNPEYRRAFKNVLLCRRSGRRIR